MCQLASLRHELDYVTAALAVAEAPDPKLVPAIREVFEQYRGHHDVRHLLLRLIREGKLQGCGDLALSVATDARIDNYSRICGIQILESGTDQEKADLKSKALQPGAALDRSILAALIHTLYPTHLSVAEVVDLLENAPRGRESGYDALQRSVIAAIEITHDEAGIAEFLRRLVALLSAEPLIGDWCRISTRNGWMIPSAFATAKVLIAKRPMGPFEDVVLSVIVMGSQCDHMRMYTGDIHKEAIDLLRTNRDLRNAVFWREAARRRRELSPERLVDAWRVSLEQSIQHIDLEDVPTLLKDLAA